MGNDMWCICVLILSSGRSRHQQYIRNIKHDYNHATTQYADPYSDDIAIVLAYILRYILPSSIMHVPDETTNTLHSY
jgi:hypothetical protein